MEVALLMALAILRLCGTVKEAIVAPSASGPPNDAACVQHKHFRHRTAESVGQPITKQLQYCQWSEPGGITATEALALCVEAQ